MAPSLAWHVSKIQPDVDLDAGHRQAWTMPGRCRLRDDFAARHRRCLASVRHRLASKPVIVDAQASMPSGVDHRVMPGGVGDRSKLVTSIAAAAWSFLLVIAAL